MADHRATRPTVGAVIIAKNAETLIADCLASVAWMDEIVLLDSDSDDRTVAIAEQHRARVVVEPRWHGFGPQRQRAQSHATADWLFWIDVDERMTSALHQELESLLQDPNLKPQHAYSVPRATDFFGRTMRHSGWYPNRVVRFHHRQSYRFNTAQVHEKLDVPQGKVRLLSGELVHLTTERLDHYLKKSAEYADTWGKERARKGQKTTVPAILARSLASFVNKFVFQAGFLDGRHGLLLALQSSHYVFNKYLALWIYGEGYRPIDANDQRIERSLPR